MKEDVYPVQCGQCGSVCQVACNAEGDVFGICLKCQIATPIEEVRLSFMLEQLERAYKLRSN